MHIFFSDLDGTLLNDEKEITPRTKQALDAFIAAGNCFVISTGRPLSNSLSIQERFGLSRSGTYISAYNGAVIYDCAAGKTLYETGIPQILVSQILQIADACHVHLQAYQGRYIISRIYNDQLQYYRERTHMPVIIAEDMLSELTSPPRKLLAIDLEDRSRLEKFYDAVIAQLGSYLALAFSGPYYLELFPSDAGKGKALVRLCRYLHIPVENSVAAGDAENDISMLKAAGYSICMCNAALEIKKIAARITETDNNHDGLVPFIEELT